MARNSRQTESIPKRGQHPTPHSSDIAVANLRCAAGLMAALVEGGVRHVVISSGSRCAPLVVAVGGNSDLQLWTNPDERSAAFFALGAAKGSKHPAALICTSGTAAANYFPAVIEARMSAVPLVVITADRPPRLRGSGAPQTINQTRLYGDYALCFSDLPVPGLGNNDVHEWMTAARRAVQLSVESSGPVHLNAPFEEPLLVDHESVASILAEVSQMPEAVSTNRHQSTIERTVQKSFREIGPLINEAKRPIIVCGPQSDADGVLDVLIALAARIGAPILVDVASQLRSCMGVISHADLILRDEHLRASLAPDCLLRLGGQPTSKSVNEWIASSPAKTKIGISAGHVADPDKCLTHSVSADCCSALRELLDSGVIERRKETEHVGGWRRLDHEVAAILSRTVDGYGELLESAIVAQVCHNMTRDMNLFLSNSMPIRWADMYAAAHERFPRVFVNRGANGIDGIISTAAGVAKSTQRPTVCVVGDIAFLHDQNGLWKLASERVPLKIVLLNNDGGGVFHFLPIASHTEHFEPLVAMPHGTNMLHLAAAHGIPFRRAKSLHEFAECFAASIEIPAPEIIEVHTDRSLNHKRHLEVVARVTRVARKTLGLE